MFKGMFVETSQLDFTSIETQKETARLANECQKLAQEAANERQGTGHVTTVPANEGQGACHMTAVIANGMLLNKQNENDTGQVQITATRLTPNKPNQNIISNRNDNQNDNQTSMCVEAEVINENQSEEVLHLESAEEHLTNQGLVVRTPERPGSLNLQPWDDEDGCLSWSSDSTITPAANKFYYYYSNTHLSPDETLV